MIGVLVTLIVIGLICGLAYWAVGVLPIPQPFRQVIIVLVVVLCVVWAIYTLLPLTGGAAHLSLGPCR